MRAPPQRALMIFHHILSSRKIASLQSWSRELGLCGLIKTGYPGIVLVAGNQEVPEYVRRVKRLRWQTCSLKALEDVDGPASMAHLHKALGTGEARNGHGLLQLDDMKSITALLRRADAAAAGTCTPTPPPSAQKASTGPGEWERFYSAGMKAP